MANPQPMDSRLEELENRVRAIETKKRDPWDKFQILASLLIPASITFVGYVYSQSIKAAEIQSNERITTEQQVMNRVQTRVGQAQLIATFMDALLSDKPERQRLAVEAVMVALPEDGPRLVAIVSKDSSRPEAKQTARSLLDHRRERLIQDCFSSEKPTRIQATTELVQGWRSDDQLIPALLAFASANKNNSSGIINTLVVLENVDKALLLANGEALKSFLNDSGIRSIGPQTQEHIGRVENRLRNL